MGKFYNVIFGPFGVYGETLAYIISTYISTYLFKSHHVCAGDCISVTKVPKVEVSRLRRGYFDRFDRASARPSTLAQTVHHCAILKNQVWNDAEAILKIITSRTRAGFNSH